MIFKNLLYKYIVMFLIFLFLIIFILIIFVLRKKETFNNLINSLNKKNTLIIVGKGPNLSKFLENYYLYKDFDTLGLNNSILTNKIKFKYYLQQDFTNKLNLAWLKKKFNKKHQYSKHIISNIDNNLNINNNQTLKYAINNNIHPIISKIKFDNGSTPNYNLIPKYFIKNKDKINFINVKFTNKNILKNEKNNIIIPKNIQPGTCLTVALSYAVTKKYKNILLTGITMYNNNNKIISKYKKYLKLFKKEFPDVKLYCLYPLDDTKGIFDVDII